MQHFYKLLLFYFFTFLSLFLSYRTFASENTIKIYFDKQESIDKNIFGTNLLGYESRSCANYGAGIWDPIHKESVKEVIELAKEAGITTLRFPGGCGTHHYNWKNAIGAEREHFLYGTDEFLKTCQEIGAEPVFTVSYFTGDEQDAADLVEYVNGKETKDLGFNGQESGGTIKGARAKERNWWLERAKNGHPEPYGVKYFEIGNEVYHGDHRGIEKVLPEEYAWRYLKYHEAMKAVDPSVKIGVVLHTPDWNRKVLAIVTDKLDFGIVHTYPAPPINKQQLEKMEAKDLFSITLAMPVLKDEPYLQDTLNTLREKAGKDVPLAITEYNGGFVQEKPVPYRHCLGTALLNAELLRIFMKPENNILMANHWNFINEYWGMIKSKGDFTKPGYLNYRILMDYYIKRPNYYVYEMYHKHFGNRLIKAEVQCQSYDMLKCINQINIPHFFSQRGRIIGNNLLPRSWTITEFKGVRVEEDGDILTIEFLNPAQFNYYHAIKKARIEPGAIYKITGQIKTEDLVAPTGVCLEVQDGRGWNATRSAVATPQFKGTTDWTYVETIYKTLPDASEINVIARRIGETGPLKGKAFFRDVKFFKFKPAADVPYLSVNASTNDEENKIYLMVINKNMNEGITSTIQLRNFLPSSKGNAWILNGPSVDATNEDNPDNVKVKHVEFKVEGLEPEVGSRESEFGNPRPIAKNLDPMLNNSFTFTFEPHSLTAIEIEKGSNKN